MWFPYSLPTTFKIEGDRQRANDSQVDDTPREFLVAFQLRNPVSNAWSVELHLTETKTLRWREPDGNVIQLSLFPDEDSRLSEAVCKLSDTCLQKAVGRSYFTISKLLDFWSCESGRGFSVAGLRAADLRHDARWRAMPHWPSALELPFKLPDSLPDGFWSAAQLYREGRTSSNDRYRFLCCYSLIGKWSRAEAPFDWRLRNSPEAAEIAMATISREIMALSGSRNFSPELESVPIERLPEALAPWHSRAIALVVDGHDGQESGEFTARQEWAAIANVADIAAHTILSRTIAYWRESAPGTGQRREVPALATQFVS